MAVAPANAQRYRADLTRFVVVGDSISAGFQGNNFVETGQLESFPTVIARQANVDLRLPLVKSPGFPGPDPNHPFLAERVNPAIQATNLAVPGHQLRDALDARPGQPMRPRDYYPVAGLQYLTALVLGFPGVDSGGRPVSRSQIEWAEALNPTTVSLWIGNNDVVAALLTGDPSAMTPAAQFTVYFTQLMTRLALTRATILVANIPDVTELPFVMEPGTAYAIAHSLVPGAPFNPQADLVKMGITNTNLRITGTAIPGIAQMIATQTFAALTPNFILTPAEITAIRNRVKEFNAVIASNAFVFNLINREKVALVDIHSLMKGIPAAQLPTLFSNDFVHPNKTGQVILANEFIRVLNTRFGMSIAPAIP